MQEIAADVAHVVLQNRREESDLFWFLGVSFSFFACSMGQWRSLWLLLFMIPHGLDGHCRCHFANPLLWAFRIYSRRFGDSNVLILRQGRNDQSKNRVNFHCKVNRLLLCSIIPLPML